jgi:hypothetical protein
MGFVPVVQAEPAVSGAEVVVMPATKKKGFLSIFVYNEDVAAIETIRNRMVGLSGKNYASAVARQAIVEMSASRRSPSKSTREAVEGVGKDRKTTVFRLDEKLRDMLNAIVERCEFKSEAAAMRWCLRAAAEIGGAS